MAVNKINDVVFLWNFNYMEYGDLGYKMLRCNALKV